MPKDYGLTKDDFDALLNWFSSNRDEAGAKYVEIRDGLIRYFNFKGCTEPETLADETINRVAGKFSTLDINNPNKHITYFYGFAANVYREFIKKIKPQEVELNVNLRSPMRNEEENKLKENQHQCLEKCLSNLSPEERTIAIQYFSKEKSAKFEHRRQLAEQNNLKLGALHVKVHRLKATLKICVEKCLDKK